MTLKEHVLNHCHKSALHHSAIAKTEDSLSKAHTAIAEAHTDQVLAQAHRDVADGHAARAQHHQAHAKHFLEMHNNLGGISPELLDEHSDAGDQLRDSAGHNGLLKRLGFIEV